MSAERIATMHRTDSFAIEKELIDDLDLENKTIGSMLVYAYRRGFQEAKKMAYELAEESDKKNASVVSKLVGVINEFPEMYENISVDERARRYHSDGPHFKREILEKHGADEIQGIVVPDKKDIEKYFSED